VSDRTLRNWRRQDQLDRGERDEGLTGDAREELQRFRREDARLKQERDLLERSAAFSARRDRDPVIALISDETWKPSASASDKRGPSRPTGPRR
jgi:transposase-like protein